MNLTVETTSAFTIIVIEGELDTATAPMLERAIEDCLGQGTQALLLDLAATDYVSSMGLRVFLTALKTIKAHAGRLILSGLNEDVQEIMDMAGFSPLFEISESTQEARSWLGDGSHPR